MDELIKSLKIDWVNYKALQSSMADDYNKIQDMSFISKILLFVFVQSFVHVLIVGKYINDIYHFLKTKVTQQ